MKGSRRAAYPLKAKKNYGLRERGREPKIPHTEKKTSICRSPICRVGGTSKSEGAKTRLKTFFGGEKERVCASPIH